MNITFKKVTTSSCRDIARMQQNPAYLRLYFLAVAEAKSNGHAEFKRGELARALGKGGKRFRNVEGAIAQAVGYGLLASESMPVCLVLPLSHVDPYDRGAAQMPCATHGGTPIPLKVATCHPGRRHYAKSLCEPCYKSARRSAKALEQVQEQLAESQEQRQDKLHFGQEQSVGTRHFPTR